VRVVTEHMPGALSVTTGFYVGVGARDEAPHLQGASHFLEHLLFKGTPERGARQIAQTVDAVGGEMNAYTAREHTAFYTRMPAAELALGLDLLGDVVTRPAFRPAEIDAEREVILEELLMSEDDPDDVVHTALWEALFPNHPVGREVLGTPETVGNMARDDIVAFHGRWYRPANLVVAAAGDLEHGQVVAAVAARFEGTGAGERPERTPPEAPPIASVVVTRPTEQVHVALGWRGLPQDDDDRYAFAVANHVLGGGASSRLFQEIREQRGLAYSVFSSPSGYSDCGALVIGAGTAPSRLGEVLEISGRIVADLLAEGITEEEHRVALGYLEGSMLLGLEDSGSRMARLANGELVRGDVIPVAEHVARIRAVTRDDVQRTLRRVLDEPRTLAVVGPLEADDDRLAAR
jgi:predicted Zn-dependent peptidase